MSAKRHGPQRSKPVWYPMRTALTIKRLELGLTMDEMAAELGVSVPHLRQVLNGTRISRPLAEGIAELFGMPTEDLFIRIDPDFKKAAVA